MMKKENSVIVDPGFGRASRMREIHPLGTPTRAGVPGGISRRFYPGRPGRARDAAPVRIAGRPQPPVPMDASHPSPMAARAPVG